MICSIDDTSYRQRPDNGEIESISGRLCRVELTVGELAERVSKGQTWAAVFSGRGRSNETFVQAELLAVDVDNGLEYEEAMHRCRTLDIEPCLSYPTFRHTEELPRFRMVWRLDRPVESPDAYRNLVKALLLIYKEADGQCHDPSRIFFGTCHGIWHVDESTCISPEAILDAAGGWLYGHDPKHAKERFENLRPLINELIWSDGTACKKVPSPGFGDETNIYNIGSVTQSHEMMVSDLRDVDFDRIELYCTSYSDHMRGAALHHDVTFGLLTNLLCVRGGEARFRQGLSLRYEWGDPTYRGKWIYQTKKVKGYQYHPERCENFCPHAEECEHYGNLLGFGKRSRGEVRRIPGHVEEVRSTVEEGEENLRRIYERAKAAKDNYIHLIIGEVGLGKTTCFLNESNALIVVPTHDLANEAVGKMHAAGNTYAFAVPDLAKIDPLLNDEMDIYRRVGDHSGAMHVLLSRIKKAERDVKHGVCSETDSRLLDYSRRLEQMKAGGVTCIITHCRMLLSTIDPDRYDLVIVDEDILTECMRVGKCKVSDILALHSLAVLAKGEVSDHLQTIAGRAIDADSGVVHERDHFVLHSSAGIIKHIVENRKMISSSVVEWLDCDVWAKVQERAEEILYFCRRPQLPDCKLIVMSATANPDLYEMAFPSRVKVYRVDNLIHKGRIIQICGGFSRNSLLSEKAEELLDYVRSIVGDTPVITFKMLSHTDELNVSHDYYMGKLEGTNSFEGKDLAVLGTPHINPVAYHMYAAALGLKPRIADMKPALRTVKRNGWEFDLVSYPDDSVLQLIQLWLIESELVQAVGRARTLRHDCTVYVFADLPLRQADVVVGKNADASTVRSLGCRLEMAA